MRRTIARGGRGPGAPGRQPGHRGRSGRAGRAAGRHRLAARPAVADRSGEPARDPGRLRRERRACASEMAAAHAASAAAAAALAGFAADARARAEREDLLRFQLGELDAARPVPGEDQTLAAERERLRGAEKFHAATAGGEETLYAGDGAVERADRGGAARSRAARRRSIRRWRPRSTGCARRPAAVEDVARDLGRYARGVRSDPARLAEIEERLFLLSRLRRKHGGTVADLAARRDALAAELAEIGIVRGGRWPRARRRRRGGGARRRRRGRPDRVAQAARPRSLETQGRRNPARARALASARLPMLTRGRASWGATGADRVRFLFAPEPGGGAATAGEDRVGRRAVAGHAGGQAGAGADRPGADLRVRRGRRGRGRRRPPR